MKIGQCYKHPQWGLVRIVCKSPVLQEAWRFQVLEPDGTVIAEYDEHALFDWPEFEFLAMPRFMDIAEKLACGGQLTALEHFIYHNDPAAPEESRTFITGLMAVVNDAAAGRLFS